MSRLTSYKEVSEMDMCELAYNSCYAKDGKARYRDFEEDFDAREAFKRPAYKSIDVVEYVRRKYGIRGDAGGESRV